MSLAKGMNWQNIDLQKTNRLVKEIMKTIHKAYKFRLEPNDEQKVLLAKHFGCVRFVYNHFLSERKKQYDFNHKSDNYYTQAKKLTEL